MMMLIDLTTPTPIIFDIWSQSVWEHGNTFAFLHLFGFLYSSSLRSGGGDCGAHGGPDQMFL
jgi:hypothetical protein